jgi:hypothetical protein
MTFRLALAALLMIGARIRGGPKIAAELLTYMGTESTRAGRARYLGREVFVLSARRGSCRGVDPAADRHSDAGRARGRRGACANPWGWIEGLSVQTGMRGLTDRAGRWACEAAATGTRWGKSERAGLQIDVQQFSEIFGRTPVDGSCASRRHEHEPAGARAAAREPALTDRGAFARRRPRPTDKPQTELSGLSAVDWGGTERRQSRQPDVNRSRRESSCSHNPPLFVKRGQGF